MKDCVGLSLENLFCQATSQLVVADRLAQTLKYYSFLDLYSFENELETQWQQVLRFQKQVLQLRKLPTDQHTQSYLVDLETEDNGKWHTDSLGVSRFIVIRMRRKKSQPSLPAVPKDDAEEARLEKKWFQSNIGTREKTSKRLTQSQSSRLTKKRGDSTELTASTSVSTRVAKRVANQDLQEPAKKGGLVGWQAPIKKMARSQKWEKQRVLHHLGLVQDSKIS